MSLKSRMGESLIRLQSGDTIVAGKSAIKGAYQMFLKALPVAGAFAFF